MQVNPQPLSVVQHRAFAAEITAYFVFCRKTKTGVLRAASVHRDGCRRAPADGKQLADGSRWTVTVTERSGLDALVGEAEQEADIQTAICCSSCGGW